MKALVALALLTAASSGEPLLAWAAWASLRPAVEVRGMRRCEAPPRGEGQRRVLLAGLLVLAT